GRAMQRLHKIEVAGVHVTELEQRGADVVVREGRRKQPLTESIVRGAQVADVAAKRVKAGWTAALLPEPHAASFYRDRFEQMLVDDYEVVRQQPSFEPLDAVEAVLGVFAPPELRQLLLFRGGVNLGWCNFGEWRIWPDDLIPVDLSADNSFEALLAT